VLKQYFDTPIILLPLRRLRHNHPSFWCPCMFYSRFSGNSTNPSKSVLNCTSSVIRFRIGQTFEILQSHLVYWFIPTNYLIEAVGFRTIPNSFGFVLMELQMINWNTFGPNSDNGVYPKCCRERILAILFLRLTPDGEGAPSAKQSHSLILLYKH
jgi:hypothetical protein